MALNFRENIPKNNGLLVTLDIHHKQFGLRYIYIDLNRKLLQHDHELVRKVTTA
jgi:hypothetical protein